MTEYAKFLRDLAANGPAEDSGNKGACCLFDDMFDAELINLIPDYVFTQWAYYSGNKVYPIPSTVESQSEFEIFHFSRSDGEMWTGEYGKLRRDWCLHLAEYFESPLALKLDAIEEHFESAGLGVDFDHHDDGVDIYIGVAVTAMTHEVINSVTSPVIISLMQQSILSN